MPALNSGLGGAYQFGAAALGGKQAQARASVGTATGAELIALRGRTMLGIGKTEKRQKTAANDAKPTPQPTGTGAQQQRLKERADRLASKK
jgi:type IV secretion system protein VirB6